MSKQTYSPIIGNDVQTSYSAIDVDGAPWELCFVCKTQEVEGGLTVDGAQANASKIKEIKSTLDGAGLSTHLYLSVQGDETYLLVRSPEPVLEAIATRPCADTELEVMSDEVSRFASSMTETFNLPNFKVPTKSDLAAYGVVDSCFEPYRYLRLPFVCGHPQKRDLKKGQPGYQDLYKDLYKSFERPGAKGAMCGDGRTYFTTAHRIKLLVDFIMDPEEDDGLGIDVKKLVATDDTWAFFPLHSPGQREALVKEWLGHPRSFLGWIQPFNRWFHLEKDTGVDQGIECIQDYLGEEMALYFAFLGSACRWLFWLGILGACVQVVVYIKGTVELPIVGLFSAVVAVWASLFTEFWKRREAYLALTWGMSSFEEKEEVRQEYKMANRSQVPTIVEGRWDYPAPSVYDVNRTHAFANGVTAISILAIIVANVFLYLFKIWMMKSSNALISENYATLFSVALSVTIKIADVIYGRIVDFVVVVENHRTETELKDSKVAKMFFFNVISSFGSVAYSAFFEQQLEGSCGTMPCMPFLTKSISTILVTRLALSIVTDNIVPRIKAYRRFKAETAGNSPEETERFRNNLSPAEREFFLDAVDPEEDISRYMDQVLMFGYMVLFVTVFPVGPFIGYVSNIQQVHQFGSAVLWRKQRTIPEGAQDIGSFQGCFETMATLAMMSNSALVFFSMQDKLFKQELPQHIIVWLFFGTMGIVRLLVLAVMAAVEDVPRNVKFQQKRQEFLKARLIDLVPMETAGGAPLSWAEVRYRDLQKNVLGEKRVTSFEETVHEFKHSKPFGSA